MDGALAAQGWVERWLSTGAQAASRLDPRSAAAMNMLGLCYTSQGRLQDGIDSYRKALRLDAALVDTWSNLAIAHKEASAPPRPAPLRLRCCTPDSVALDSRCCWGAGTAECLSFLMRRVGSRV